MKNILTLFLFTLLSSFALNAQIRLALEPVANGFAGPVDITNAGDERLFVVEKNGVIRILYKDGTVESTPFLNIDPRVESSSGEQGLLGLAFDPDYANNGYFYVNYTNQAEATQISRFSVSDNNPNLANPASELKILEVPQPFSNHNAGDLAFGPDGYLYITMGDGGSGGDPGNRSQNRTNLLGKLLRIDVSNATPNQPYVIPPDNPFAFDDFTLDEIWAIGLRNPWRIAFDRETGDLWIADVGQDAREEINFQEATSNGGENYGWRCYEGFANFNTNGCNDASQYTPPLADYNHLAFGFCTGSVTGGFVYRGEAFPSFDGTYFFADYCTGDVMGIAPGTSDIEVLLNVPNSNYTTFGQDNNGELYIAQGNGSIFQLVVDCAGFSVAADDSFTCPGTAEGTLAADPFDGVGPFNTTWSNGATTAQIDGLEVGSYAVTITDVDNCEASTTVQIFEFPVVPLEILQQDALLVANGDFSDYQWFKDGTLISGATSNTLEVTESGEYELIATDENGCRVTSNTIVILSTTNEIPGLSELEIQPNPFQETIQLSFELEQREIIDILLLDGMGRLLRKEVVNMIGATTVNFNTTDLPAGQYVLMLRAGKNSIAKKVVKQ